jgi:thioredoxin reductase (NADPH)
MELHDVVIVGAGPAGLTAGIYCARAGLKTLILERSYPGGQVTRTALIENYPGFAHGTTGIELAEIIHQQAIKFGCAIRTEAATALALESDRVLVRTVSEGSAARAIIVASGADPKRLGVPGEDRLFGRGVSTCAVCDGPLFKNQVVAVVGGGDSALSEALYLSRLCSKVMLIHRRDQFRAAEVIQDRVKSTPNIELRLNTLIAEITGGHRVEGVRITKRLTGASQEIPLQGVFLYVGLSPNTEFLHGVVDLDEQGFVITDENMQTSSPLIFAGGDCRRKNLRQVATAVGDGATAARSAEEAIRGSR